MNSLSAVIDSFNAIKEKGWIKSCDKDDDFYFPICDDINIKCTSKNNRYPIWLLSLNHGLEEKYFNDDYDFSIETDRFSHTLKLIVYQNNVVVLRKPLIDLQEFEDHLNKRFECLGLVYLENKTRNKIEYFRYSQLRIYRFRGSNMFLKLLNDHTISIKLNKNSIVFNISKRDIEKLFKMEYHFDDTLNNFLTFLNN